MEQDKLKVVTDDEKLTNELVEQIKLVYPSRHYRKSSLRFILKVFCLVIDFLMFNAG